MATLLVTTVVDALEWPPGADPPSNSSVAVWKRLPSAVKSRTHLAGGPPYAAIAGTDGGCNATRIPRFPTTPLCSADSIAGVTGIPDPGLDVCRPIDGDEDDRPWQLPRSVSSVRQARADVTATFRLCCQWPTGIVAVETDAMPPVDSFDATVSPPLTAFARSLAARAGDLGTASHGVVNKPGPKLQGLPDNVTVESEVVHPTPAPSLVRQQHARAAYGASRYRKHVQRTSVHPTNVPVPSAVPSADLGRTLTSSAHAGVGTGTGTGREPSRPDRPPPLHQAAAPVAHTARVGYVPTLRSTEQTTPGASTLVAFLPPHPRCSYRMGHPEADVTPAQASTHQAA